MRACVSACACACVRVRTRLPVCTPSPIHARVGVAHDYPNSFIPWLPESVLGTAMPTDPLQAASPDHRALSDR